jgi:hypothetical protein
MYNKKIEIFGTKFNAVPFFTAMLFSGLAVWSMSTIIVLFSTGPFFLMVFWIFKLTFDITLATYHFNMGRILANG